MDKQTNTIPGTKRTLNDRKHPQPKSISSSSSRLSGITKKIHYPKKETSVAFSPRGVIAFSIREKNDQDVQEGVTNNVVRKVDATTNPGGTAVKLQSFFYGFNSSEDSVLEPEMVAHLATSYDFPLSLYCTSSPDDLIQLKSMQLEQAKNACETNQKVAVRLGLDSIAAMWSTLNALIPQRVSVPHPNPNPSEPTSTVIAGGIESTLSATFPFVLDILSSLLVDFLEGGDVLHVVVICEILRSSGMLDAVVDSSNIATIRIRQAYMAYIQLLKKFQLFSLATEIISVSTDPEISKLTKADIKVHSKCGTCFKELSGDCAWCATCRKYACKCVLCHKPIRGLLHWCPVCAHGGHRNCLEKWFSKSIDCPSGCGHECRSVHQNHF